MLPTRSTVLEVSGRHYSTRHYTCWHIKAGTVQASEGQLREGVYIPSSGFKTDELRKQMAEFYDMPEEEVEKAIEFAESEEYVDIYCFTFCITGGPMEPTAFKVAGLQGMDKEAILQW